MAWWCITSAAKTATFAPLNSNISTVEIINCPPFFDSLDICELEIHVVVGEWDAFVQSTSEDFACRFFLT